LPAPGPLAEAGETNEFEAISNLIPGRLLIPGNFILKNLPEQANANTGFASAIKNT
jgi:hypothetical protein